MKMEKNNIKMMPSLLVSEFEVWALNMVFRNKTENPTVTKAKIGICFRMTSSPILNGLIKTATPKITRIFVMLLPMMLPNNKSVFPER